MLADSAMTAKIIDGKGIAANLRGKVADAVLTHPLISATGRRLGTVVHREELTRLLLWLTDDSAELAPDAKAELKQVLARNGIADPAPYQKSATVKA